jgi:hypothetical protein
MKMQEFNPEELLLIRKRAKIAIKGILLFIIIVFFAVKYFTK